MFKRAGMLAADGRCKTLDSAADGYVRGEACASAMLQLLSDAADQSAAIACILGSAVNQDGRSSSLTAPNGPAQQGVIRQALGGSILEPSDVATLQLHGTGIWHALRVWFIAFSCICSCFPVFCTAISAVSACK